MLTGDPPFTGSTAQAIVARVVTESPRPMLPQRGTIPAHVEAAVMTSLQKLPADRFKTAAEFAGALADSRYASASTVAMPAASAPRSRVAALTPWVVAGVALVAGLVIGARVLARPAADPSAAPLDPDPHRVTAGRDAALARTGGRWPTSAARATGWPSTPAGWTG